MVRKGQFLRISFIVVLIFQAHFESIRATKEELDERILSPKSDDEKQSDNEETPNFFPDGLKPGEDGPDNPFRFPCIYFPASFYEAILAQNMNGDEGGGGEEGQNYVKRGGGGFQPWGGKRSFQPWGGKRSFQPWGGKRSFQPWGGKRSSFQPWGGKRAFTGYIHRMSNFAGKRDPAGGDPRPPKSDVPTARRSTFNPWGG